MDLRRHRQAGRYLVSSEWLPCDYAAEGRRRDRYPGAPSDRRNRRAVRIVAVRRHSRSKTEFAVRAETHEIEMPGVGLAVDQDHVGPDVAVPMVLPFTGKRMVAMARRERPILRQVGQNTCKVGIKGLGEAAFLLAPVIPLEDRGSPNRPH